MNDALGLDQDMLCKVWIDGAARGNPGPSSVGVVIRQGTIRIEGGYYLGFATNNYAEYAALIVALTMVRQMNAMPVRVEIRSDSLLLVKQLSGEYRVKHQVLKELHKHAIELLQGMDIRIMHVVRSENQDADACANNALDKRIALPVGLAYLFRHKESENALL